MRILYDSKNSIFKKPFGCIMQQQNCIINIHIPQSCETVSAFLHIEREDGFKKEVELKKSAAENLYDIFSGEFTLEECGLYFYWFIITTGASTFALYRQGEKDTNIEEGEKWQLTCYEKGFDTPKNFKGNVMYQIFPDRFNKSGECDLTNKLTPYRVHESMMETPDFLPDENGKILNNDFYGGNLKGICEKLPYIKELGVSTIYLNPIFMAYSNHRYDTCDYKTIDPMLGTECDFTNLCNAAHKLDIKIILDGVFSHTGSNSIYFDKNGIFGNGAVSSNTSPYKNWYNFTHYPDAYESWWGIDTLPCTNELNPDFIEYIVTGSDSVVKHWLNAGADGFRLDVADELPDEFIKILHDTVKQTKPNAIVIGEVWEDASNKISYSKRRKYFSDTELDSVMNYPFQNAIIALAKGDITVHKFACDVMTICENYPKPVLDCLMNSLSTHDTTRILTKLSSANEGMAKENRAYYQLGGTEYNEAMSKMFVAVMLQFVLPGSACIYYGDEIGMQGFNDPFNRGYFKWNDINYEILSYYLFFGKLKATNSALKDGKIDIKTEDGVLYIKRYDDDNKIYAVLNTSDKSVSLQGKTLMSHNATVYNNCTIVGKNGFAVLESVEKF